MTNRVFSAIVRTYSLIITVFGLKEYKLKA
jgi:hypothetical protein